MSLTLRSKCRDTGVALTNMKRAESARSQSPEDGGLGHEGTVCLPHHGSRFAVRAELTLRARWPGGQRIIGPRMP